MTGINNSDSLAPSECLDYSSSNPDACEGRVAYRMPLSGTGRSFARCDKHWDARLVEQERIDNRYPVTAPSDFDPAYAGERWDEEY